MCYQTNFEGKIFWSGQQDSNLRPSGPKPDALPGCAMPRRCRVLRNGRGSKIRTCDPLVPNQMRYQAALCPDCKDFEEVVGAARFELATLWSQTRCATRLRYAPCNFQRCSAPFLEGPYIQMTLGWQYQKWILSKTLVDQSTQLPCFWHGTIK